jgi:N-acetylglucosamine-6-phosphate deacetylase
VSALRIVGAVSASGKPLEVLARGGRIVETAAGDMPVLDAAGAIAVPGLIDLQVNGACGWDLTDTPERLWDVAEVLGRFGVTAFAPTLITSAPAARKAALATFRAGPPPGFRGAVPLGIHFEGPMISPRRKGAHPARWLAAPSAGLIAGWSRAEGVLMATIAPELPGALEVIDALVARGVIVSLGHTEATAAQACAAVAAGARLVTHLGNAMPPLLAREPGLVGAALGGDVLVAGVIADGVHHDPLSLRTAWRALAPGRFLAVTDTTAALGQPDGPYRLGDQDVIVADGTVRLAVEGTLAGSAASLSQCLRTLRAQARASLAEAVAACTATPARVVGDPSRGTLEAGARADVTLLDRQTLDPVATIVAGRVIHDARGVKEKEKTA